jgi:hypothetical protein
MGTNIGGDAGFFDGNVEVTYRLAVGTPIAPTARVVVEDKNTSSTGIYAHSVDGYGLDVKSDNNYAALFEGRTYFTDRAALHVLGSNGSTSLCLNANEEISWCSSSLRYKTSVETFSRGLDVVGKLRPIRFDWKANGHLTWASPRRK